MIIPILKSWIPAAAIITLLCGVIYITVQQNYRSNANDPQIRMAEDAAYALNNGADARALVSNAGTDISRSLKPYLIFYDENKAPVTSDGVLDGKIPTLPAGVLDFTRENREDRISWQPRAGVRSALEILHVPGHGFVVAGRSLRVVEEQEAMLTKQVIVGWISSLGILLLLIAALQMILK